MKKRSGFVTNSSSSSFILGFSNSDSIANELKDIKNTECYKAILLDCIEKDKMTLENALRLYEMELENGWMGYFLLQDFMLENDYKSSEYEKAENSPEFRKKLNKAFDEKIEEFKEKCKGKEVFVSLMYSDDYEMNAMLEHLTYNINACVAAFSHH